MKNNLITSEDDVRAWVRLASGNKARWVEPSLGSTPGLPDCWVPHSEEQVHFELKCGTLGSDGVLKYNVRPEQRREIRAMVDDRVKVGLIIGIRDSPIVIFAMPSIPFLAGKVKLKSCEGRSYSADGHIDNLSCFQAGVNFIFLNALVGKNSWMVNFKAGR